MHQRAILFSGIPEHLPNATSYTQTPAVTLPGTPKGTQNSTFPPRRNPILPPYSKPQSSPYQTSHETPSGKPCLLWLFDCIVLQPRSRHDRVSGKIHMPEHLHNLMAAINTDFMWELKVQWLMFRFSVLMLTITKAMWHALSARLLLLSCDLNISAAHA